MIPAKYKNALRFVACCLGFLSLILSLSCNTPGNLNNRISTDSGMRDSILRIPETNRTRNIPSLPAFEPSQLTARVDSTLGFSVSRDGSRLAVTSMAGDFSGIILQSADPGSVELPVELEQTGGDRFQPHFVPEGDALVFVGTGHDVKGDIFLQRTDKPGQSPRRLTGRESSDRAPCLSPDGKKIYFQRSYPDTRTREIAVINAENLQEPATSLDIAMDAGQPAISPDGKKCALISAEGNNKSVFVFHLESGEMRRLTGAGFNETAPAWSENGNFVYFNRCTDSGDCGIWRVETDKKGAVAQPVTSGAYSARDPCLAGDRLYFVSDKSGVPNVWYLPQNGSIPSRETASSQMQLAAKIEDFYPPKLHLAALAYQKVQSRFPGQEALAAEASLQAARIYERLGREKYAGTIYRRLAGNSSVMPQSGLAEVRMRVLRARSDWNSRVDSSTKREILQNVQDELSFIAGKHQEYPVLVAQSQIERAELLMDLGGSSRDLLQALELLDKVLDTEDAPQKQKSRALLLKAETFQKAGRGDSVIPIYARILEKYPDTRPWAERAVRNILDFKLAGSNQESMQAKLRILRRVVKEYSSKIPGLAMGANNRIGDMYFDERKWSKAKAAYMRVLEEFSADSSNQYAAARLSLAEILYREEQFYKALQLYENEMANHAYEDYLYRLAWNGFVRKNLQAAQHHYELGEVSRAGNMFYNLLQKDSSLVEAHRGYIKCAAAQDRIDPTLKAYRQKLSDDPDNPVLVYATGLCLTYLEDEKSLRRARELIKRAVRMHGQVEFFHQTLGYVNEVLETVHDEQNRLELALTHYRKAFFLNSARENPRNRANLLLNLGNVNFLLGHYGQAFRFYTRREKSGVSFQNKDTELTFYYRYSQAAFLSEQEGESIQALEKGLSLIRDRLQPMEASEILGRLHRKIKEKIIMPAREKDALQREIKPLLKRQSDIQSELFKVSREEISPPPDPEWERYKNTLQPLISQQRELIPDLAPLVAELPEKKWKATEQGLYFMLDKAENALEFPLRLRDLQVEMQDRLGLAYQEDEQWSKARQEFLRAFELNQEMGNTANLAVNLRSAAYNAYRQSGDGENPDKLLRDSLQDFRRALEMVRKYGVPAQKKQESGGGLINISLDVALDDISASRAQYGFSKGQEKRLIRAFIGRIRTELGELQAAGRVLDSQLQSYPPGREVADKNLFGVSLLLHRSAHLEFAKNNPEISCKRFLRSAKLSLEMGNPVSSALNVSNAASALARFWHGKENGKEKLAELRRLERKAGRLFAEKADLVNPLTRAGYHNRLGVAYSDLARNPDSGEITSAVRSASLLANAGSHFYQGLRILRQDQDSSREKSRLRAALHINLADLSKLQGDTSSAKEHFARALDIAEKSRVPSLQWRALAGMNRFEKALRVLSKVPVFERGCGQKEILHRLAPLVLRPAGKSNPAQAFNTLERLSEWERVNRLSGLALPGRGSTDMQGLRELLQRFSTVRDLKQRLQSAGNQDKEYLENRLQQEQRLLEKEISKGQILPASIMDKFRSRERRNIFLKLAGLSAEMLHLSGRISENPEEFRTDLFRERFDQVTDRYREVLDKASDLFGPKEPAGILGMLVPSPARATDIAMELPQGKKALRLMHLPGRENPWLGFSLAPSNIGVADTSQGLEPLVSGSDYQVLIFQDPRIPGVLSNKTIALSGTHLLRCMDNKKPFKHKVLAYPGSPVLPEGFESLSLEANATAQDIAQSAGQAHCFWSNASTASFSTVPTRQEELPQTFAGMRLKQGSRMDLIRLADSLDNVSLAILNRTSGKDTYTLGHMFSLFGVPTLLLPGQDPVASSEVRDFFRNYAKGSVADAMRASPGNEHPEQGYSLQLGYWGLDAQEASGLARQNFNMYVQNGVRAYKNGDFSRALALFENGLLVVREMQVFEQYKAKLLEYSRESAFSAGEMQKAARHARDLSRYLSENSPGSRARARSLLKQGLILSRLEEFDGAVSCLQQAIDIYSELDLPLKRIQALADLGTVLENATEYDRALQGYQSAASLSQGMGASELLARQRLSIGRIYDLRLSRYAMAKEYYNKARKAFGKLDKKEEILQCNLNISRCNRLLGRFEQSGENLSRLLERARALPDSERLQTKIVLEQANSAWFQGRYQEAFNLLQDSLQRARKKDWVLEQVIALNTSGLTWWSLGKNERAMRDLNRALELAKTLEIRRDEVATTYNNIGLVQRDQGRYDRALQTLHKALDIDREIDSRWAIAYDLRNIGLTHVHQGNPEQALPLLQDALSLTREIGNRINQAKVLVAMGNCYLRLGKQNRAREYFDKSLSLSREMALRETVWRSLNGLGKIHKRKGELEEARKRFLEAVDIIEQMRAQIQVTRLRNSFVADKMEVYESLVSVLLDMGRKTEAFYTAERSRARNLIDLLGNNKLRLGEDKDQRLYERINSLKASILEQEKLVAQTEDEQASEAYKKTLEDLKDKYRDQLMQVQANRPEMRSLITVDPIEVDKFRELLDPGMTILSYYLLPDEIVCWVVTSEKLEVVRVPATRSDLKDTILEFRRSLQNLEPYESLSEELSSLLLEPVAEKLEQPKQVGIIPHRMLHYLSFAPLEYEDSSLVQEYPLFYLPSGSVLRYTLQRRSQEDKFRVLAVGNPDLDTPGLELPFAEHEVKSMGWNFSDFTELMRDNATESQVKDRVQDFDIVHIASHGDFDPLNPLFSSLKFSKGAKEDGDLKAAEIFGLDIRADLVVLSACQSGLGDIKAGDEVVGLNRAFMFAGAHTLVSSLWRVSDISTAMLMKQFYREYVDSNKAQSLRRAMLHVKTFYPHPGYWAGFILSGDYY